MKILSYYTGGVKLGTISGYLNNTSSVTNGNYWYYHYTTNLTNNTQIGGQYSLIETPDEIFKKKIKVILKDGSIYQLTYAEIYELKKMNKKPEEITKDELEDVLLVLRI